MSKQSVFKKQLHESVCKEQSSEVSSREES
jgi:hypothetical protein